MFISKYSCNTFGTNSAWIQWVWCLETRHNRDSTCCTSRVSSVIRYCTSLSSKVCCTVNTRYYYYNCAVWNCFALGVESRGFAKDKRTKLAFHMKNGCSGFNLRIVFVNCVIHHRMVDRRALGDGDKVTVTDSLLGSPWDEGSSPQCWLTLNTQPPSQGSCKRT